MAAGKHAAIPVLKRQLLIQPADPEAVHHR
jgi:hypothetical protein